MPDRQPTATELTAMFEATDNAELARQEQALRAEPTDRLPEIQARIPALYDGPWSVSWADGDGEHTPDRWVVSYPTANPLAGLVAEVADYGAELAEFIAHARTDMPWLIREVLALRSELAATTEQLQRLDGELVRLRDENRDYEKALGLNEEVTA